MVKLHVNDVRNCLLVVICILLLLAILSSTMAAPYPERDFRGPQVVNCTEDEEVCVLQGYLPHNGNCYVPLSRGPCKGSNEWFVLNTYAFENVLRTQCVPRYCGDGLFRFKGKCLNETEIYSLCGGTPFYLEVNGKAACGDVSPDPTALGISGDASSSGFDAQFAPDPTVFGIPGFPSSTGFGEEVSVARTAIGLPDFASTTGFVEEASPDPTAIGIPGYVSSNGFVTQFEPTVFGIPYPTFSTAFVTENTASTGAVVPGLLPCARTNEGLCASTVDLIESSSTIEPQ